MLYLPKWPVGHCFCETLPHATIEVLLLFHYFLQRIPFHADAPPVYRIFFFSGGARRMQPQWPTSKLIGNEGLVLQSG